MMSDMGGVVLAIAFLALVALDLCRDRSIDPRPVVSHPRWLLSAIPLVAAGLLLLREPGLFLLASALLGAAGALLCERFRLTDDGIECHGTLLAWSTLRIRRTRLFLHVLTTRGQHLRLPRWMDGLGTLTRIAARGTLPAWRPPGESWT